MSDTEIFDSNPEEIPAENETFKPYTDNLDAVRNQLRGMYQSWFLHYQ